MKEIFAREKQSGVCWNRFQDDTGDLAFVFSESGADCFDTVERKDNGFAGDCSRNARAVWLAVSERATSGFYQERINVAMVTTGELDDLVALGESASQSQTRHCRLCATVHHPHFLDCRHPDADQLRYFHLKRIRNPKADATLRRLGYGANDNWICVAQDGGPPASDVIDQLLIVHHPDARPLGVINKKRLAANSAQGADRRVHTARNPRAGAGEQVR